MHKQDKWKEGLAEIRNDPKRMASWKKSIQAGKAIKVKMAKKIK